MEELVRKNPWLGLESYKEGEILYGRDDDIRDLSQCVLNDTHTLLYGKSGIGKSSILNAGILPAARRHGYLPVVIRLSHKEQHSYLQQIHRYIINAILNSQSSDLNDTDVLSIDKTYTSGETASLVKEIVPCKDLTTESIYEYFHRHKFYNVDGERIKLLIIFDQFEEIFTLQDDVQKKKAFFEHLADMLNDVMPEYLQQKIEPSSDIQEEVKDVQNDDFDNIFDDLSLGDNNNLPEYVTDNDIHFVFTIREDFLSEFEYYSAAIPSLKQNRYGLRPINEEQAAQIILRPIPGLIDKYVARLIIEKITGKKDFKLDGIPEIEVDSAVLSLYLNRLYEAKEGEIITKDLVEQKGGEIISDFYNDAISDISETTIEYLENMLLNGQGRRDNITVYDAVNEGKVSEQELDILCNKKKILRLFNYAGDLRIEYVHDILCGVVNKHREERIERVEKEKQNRRLKHLKRERTGILLTILILIGLIVSYWLALLIPISHKYGSITKQWGRFVGVEPLTEEQVAYRPHHIVLKKNGYFTESYSSMECRDQFGNLTTNHGLKPYIVNGEDSTMLIDFRQKLNTVCKFEFIKDPINENYVIQERAYDKDGNFVYAFNYNKPQKPKVGNVESTKIAICSYVDEQGLPLEILSSGYRFIRITYDDNGRDMLVEYFDWDGNPSTNADGAYQTYSEYDDLGQCISQASLNIYGKRMIDNAGNCGLVFKYDGYHQIEVLSVDEFGREKAVHEGYSRMKAKYDVYGRVIEMSYWNEDGPVFIEGDGFHKLTTSFGDNNTVVFRCYDCSDEQIGLVENRYDANGNLVYHFIEQDGGKLIENNKFDRQNNRIYGDRVSIQGVDTIGVMIYEKSSNIETTRDDGKYIQKVIYDDLDRVTENSFYELDGETLSESVAESQGWNKEVHYRADNGLDKESLFLEEIDSAVYYNGDQLHKIEVIKNALNRNYIVKKSYDADTILTEFAEILVDRYNNMIEEVQGQQKALYFINAKSNTPNGNSVGYVSKYKFPLLDLGSYVMVTDDKWIFNPCDENGCTDIPSSYQLPEIYAGKPCARVVFIECNENGRIWHGVILSTDTGISYGGENYNYELYKYTNEVLCLNLTTMRVAPISIVKLDYWTIYQRDVPKLQYDLFAQHYYDYMSNLDNSKTIDWADNKLIVLGTVEGDEGYLVNHGYSGQFHILQWCDWDCTQSVAAFEDEFIKRQDSKKNIVLLPVERDSDGNEDFKDIIRLDDIEGKLGLRIMGDWVKQQYYQNQVISRYDDWKKQME